MFKKFTTEEVSTQNQIKSSVQRGVRGKHHVHLADSSHRPKVAFVTLKRETHRGVICSVVSAAKVLELYPFLEETGVIDEILPKKEQAALAKL